MTTETMTARQIGKLCTFHRNGQWCGLPDEDETNHVWPDERMRPGAHVWRHEPKDAERLLDALAAEPVESLSTPEQTAYRKGYQAGHQAARMAARRAARPPCDHQGIGLPWCPTCGPRTRAELARLGVAHHFPESRP